jgi:hypothetical protein
MDAHEFAICYPRLAAELRHIQINAMPARVQTPRGPRPAAHVLPEVAFATALFTAVTVWLAIGLARWDWAAWVWSPATISALLVVRGLGATICCARALIGHWWAGRR